MKGKYKAAIALLLALILLPLALLTLTHWVPTLAGIWLPVGTRISLHDSPRLTRSALRIPDLRYLVGDCELARITNARLSHPSRWRLQVDELDINSACLSKLPESEPASGAPRTLAEWQSMLPYSWLTIDNLRLSPWEKWQGRLVMSLTPQQQDIGYSGKEVTLQARLRGQALTVSDFSAQLVEGQAPVKLVGEFHMPLVPDGLPVDGHLLATSNFRRRQDWLMRSWSGRKTVGSCWSRRAAMCSRCSTCRGKSPRTYCHQRWPLEHRVCRVSAERPRGLVGWQLATGHRADAGQRSSQRSHPRGSREGQRGTEYRPWQAEHGQQRHAAAANRRGQARRSDCLCRAAGEPDGPLTAPSLAFHPGALLRSRGRVIDSLNIDEVRCRWPG
jgi:hypothetical protein